jgi:hypothetical protein
MGEHLDQSLADLDRFLGRRGRSTAQLLSAMDQLSSHQLRPERLLLPKDDFGEALGLGFSMILGLSVYLNNDSEAWVVAPSTLFTQDKNVEVE